jgi:hypothetical protein
LWYRPHRRQPYWHTQDNDRRAGTQTGHCALALCQDGRDTGGCRLTSSGLKGLTGTSIPSTPLGARARYSADCRIAIRGGGKPYSNVALMPIERMGPPPAASPQMRMTASWSGSERTYRIQVCGAKRRRNGELPSDHTPIGNVRRPSSAGKAHLAVHRPSACSGVKALRNTSDAKRQAAKLC